MKETISQTSNVNLCLVHVLFDNMEEAGPMTYILPPAGDPDVFYMYG